MEKKFFVIVIAGPTAVGKTDVAIALAQKFKLDIISADSRQFYRELNIGTSKPTIEQLERVKHYLINSHSIDEVFTAGDFEKQALIEIENQKRQNKNAVIVCGGTGLYINALLRGLDNLPNANEEIRLNLKQKFHEFGIVYLQNQLQKLDYEAFQQIEKNNPQRLMRAIEVCIVSGKKYSDFIEKNKIVRNFDVIKIALQLDRNILYEKINKRVDSMIDAGLENEAKNLITFKNLYALRTVGYNEFFDFFDGKVTRETAIELIKQHTRNYAKRQITWFKKDKDCMWFEPTNIESIFDYLDEALYKNTE